jgi:putative FmdB family regulatory protein
MMPLYDFRCEEHGRWEVLAKVNETRACPSCGVEGVRMISLPAKTASLWGTDWRKGLGGSGFFSPSAGQRVTDKREEESIMRSRGFINEKDLGGEVFYERQISRIHDEHKAADTMAKTYTDNLKKFDGDKMRAVTETFPAQQMLEQAHAHDAKEAS